MRLHFTEHARQRAEERYGRAFTPEEMNDIFLACLHGKALLGRLRDDGTSIYRLTLDDGFVVCPVISRQKTFILTFLPSDYFTAGHGRSAAQDSGLIKQVFAGPRRPHPRPYRRERITLATLRRTADEHC